ncbi:SCO family protein [Neobacillus notoginsengisoli]|uniref:SCO family protein n=1 Tax=Neobacillus notoginsengisoli TaxID=1578198 RepID=A0A417YXV1_9BACI|nr:SCO family protein [Neobacillus notoginsengisoli]RHW42215.1 SCO family protein [Neobacillus notoginsengisoli]
MKKIIIICVAAIALGIAGGISFFIVRDALAQIPEDVELKTQKNEVYRFGDDYTKVKLIEFVYTHCPDICPTTTQKMVALKEDLKKNGVFGKDVEFITITIDPYRDTPEVMRNYMGMFGIEDDGGWIFLTGDKDNLKISHEQIRKAAEPFQFQYKDPGNGFFIHSTFTYLVDENNRFIDKFPMGKDFDQKAVLKAIMKEID